MILSTHGFIASQIQSFVGLLDTYPNAAAAYSVRKLRAAYTGSAIRVRRTDLTESDIGFTALGNLDTSALLAFTGTGALDNGFITTWYDQSGNGRNATQTTAINQPKIVNAGSVITYNGKPTMTFDGVNDFMRSALFSYSSAMSLYYVTQRVGAATSGFDAYRPEISYATTTTNDAGAFHYINPSLKGASYPDPTNFVTNSYDGFGNYANGDKYLINFDITNSTGWGVFRNNALEKNVALSTTIPSTSQGFYISHQPNPLRYAYNNFSEVIMWLTNQSANRSAINSDINSYYAIY
jgi:hypothetical protein